MAPRRWGGRQSVRYRAEVFARDGAVCAWCGGVATTVEHLTPVSLGGDPWDLGNGVPACRRCNLSRGNRARPPAVPPSPSRRW
jgi:5-methylcytosine-specific restriction endonuclease McrA